MTANNIIIFEKVRTLNRPTMYTMITGAAAS